MKQYLDILDRILKEGKLKHNRTGVDTLSISGSMIEFDMSTGKFPLLTTKKMGLKNICAELEMFIKGIASKEFLQERNCHIWDEWANPAKVPYGNDDESKRKMFEEKDLGKIYGYQWNNFNDSGINQLKNVIETLQKNPSDRRMLVSAWNPQQLGEMALPPCHYCFQLLSNDGYVDLLWNQRSSDFPLGVPYDLASYAMLLTLICQQVKMKPGKVIGFFADSHIYVNQIEGVKEQLTRTPLEQPSVKILNAEDPNWTIWDWKYTDFELLDYQSHPAIKFPVAV
jgi:thymidylate synthase